MAGETSTSDSANGSANGSAYGSAGWIVLVVVLAIVGVLAVVAGVIYLVEPAKSLPSFLGTITHPARRAAKHRDLRGLVALVVGLVLLVGAVLAGVMSRGNR